MSVVTNSLRLARFRGVRPANADAGRRRAGRGGKPAITPTATLHRPETNGTTRPAPPPAGTSPTVRTAGPVPLPPASAADAVAAPGGITSSANPSTVGRPLCFVATVGAAGPRTPTGTVTFTLDAAVVNSSPVVEGHATLEVVPAGAGPHAVVACYCGDAVLAPSSAAATFTVERAATTIGITALAQPGDRAGGG